MKTIINVYMYLSEAEKDKSLCVVANSEDGSVNYNKSMTLGDMDYEDAAAYMFGVVMRFITPFIRYGHNVKFFASQEKLIKAFGDNTIAKYGTVEKIDDNPAEKFDKDAIDMETRMVKDWNMAKSLADFSFNSMFGRGRTPLFGFSVPSFPLRPFTYIDEALPKPFRDMDIPRERIEKEPENKHKAETNKVPETVKTDDLNPEDWFASLTPEDKMAYIKKFMNMI